MLRKIYHLDFRIKDALEFWGCPENDYVGEFTENEESRRMRIIHMRQLASRREE